MRNWERIISFIMTVMIVMTVPVVAAAAEDITQTLLYQNGSAISGSVETNGTIATVGTDTKNKLRLSSVDNTGGAYAYFKGATKGETEATVISFNFYMENTDARSYVQLYDESEENCIYGTMQVFQNQDKITYFEDMVKGGDPKFSIGISAGEWIRADIWADFRTREMTYYINGQLLGNVDMPDSLMQIGGFRYMVANQGVGGVHYLDDVRMYNISKHGIAVNLEGITVPEDFSKSIVVRENREGNNLGNIYFNRDFSFGVLIDNTNTTDTNATIGYVVTDTEGRTVVNSSGAAICSKHIWPTLPANQVTQFTFPIHVEKYGLYKLRVVVYPQTSSGTDYANPIDIKEWDFSVANIPRDGVKNNWMALCDHTDPTGVGHGYEEAERKMELFSNAGFSGIRSEYAWKNIEPEDDKFGIPNGTDEIMGYVKENGMKIMGVLMTVPDFVSRQYMYVPKTETELQQYTDYVAYISAQTKDVTEYYEVWNEYNVPGFNSNNGTPADYANLLKAAKEGMKIGNPNGKIAGFAVANVGANEGYDMSALAWMEEVLKAGGGDYMDVASIHGYTHVAPEQTNSKRTWLIDETRALLDKYGYTNTPIVISEMGWARDDEISNAQWMVRYATMWYGKAEKLYWYNSQSKSKMTSEDNFGLLYAWEDCMTNGHTPYGARASFLTMANFNAMMTNSTKVGQLSLGENTYVYEFKDKNNKTLHVAWALTDTTVTIPTDLENPVVYDMYGNPTNYTRTANGVQVTLSTSPVYVTAEPEPIEVYTDYNAGTVTVTGKTDIANAKIGITVTDASVAIPTLESLAYVGQTTANMYGYYMFTFKNTAESGNYTVKVGYEGGVQSAPMEWSMNLPKLKVTGNSGSITDISQVKAGDKVTAVMHNSNATSTDEDTMLLLVQYNGDLMVDCVIGNKTGGDPTAVATVKENTTRIKAMYWKKNSLKSLVGAYSIGAN